MPGQKLTFNLQEYPQFEGLQAGDVVAFQVRGTISAMDESTVEVETSDFKMTGDNAARKSMREMMGGEQKPPARLPSYDDEDD